MKGPPHLHVLDEGDGPAMLFVHGWLNDASVWSGVIADLATDHRCLAVDLRGHGASAATGPGSYGRDVVLGDLRRVLDDRDIPSAVLVGHSLGGYLALALAIEDPDRVDGLGLIAAGPGFRNPDSLEQWNDSVRSMAAERELPEGMEAISMHVDSMVLDRLGEITAPACVVVGERDRRFRSSADVFDRYLDVRHRAIVAGAGHMVHVKAPDAVAGALRSVFGPARAGSEHRWAPVEGPR